MVCARPCPNHEAFFHLIDQNRYLNRAGTNSSSVPWIWEWEQKKEKQLVCSHVWALTCKLKGLAGAALYAMLTGEQRKLVQRKREGYADMRVKRGQGREDTHTSLPESHGSQCLGAALLKSALGFPKASMSYKKSMFPLFLPRLA